MKPADNNAFDYAVMAALHAVTSNQPERLKKLFIPRGNEGRWEISVYEPVEHKREATSTGFAEIGNLRGKENVEPFRHHW